jgi:multiple antibiotic resistance protein
VGDAIKVFLLTFSALFPIVDPLAGSPIFLAMTQDYAPQTRRALAWRVSLNSLVLMVGSYFVGTYVLNFFGVSLPVVQVGGGLIVVALGWGALLEKNESPEPARRNLQCSDALHSAFYPLTLPLTVGPGSISVAVTLGANSTRHYGFHIGIILAALVAMAAIAVSVLLCYGLADQLARVFGKSGMIVVVRLSSFLLVCIGVQIIWNGISALVSSLHI